MASWKCLLSRVLIGLIPFLLTCEAENNCTKALGMGDGRITDDMITTSSDKPGTNKTGVRQNCCGGNPGWSWCPNPARNGSKVWVEISFPKPTGVSGIFIQPPAGMSHNLTKATDYLKLYRVLYTLHGTSHMTYLANSGTPVNFTGIDENLSAGKVLFPTTVMENLRIETLSSEGEPCFRFELFGCDVKSVCPDGCDNGHCIAEDLCLCKANFNGKFCEELVIPKSSCHSPLGMESGNITDAQLEVSSAKPDQGKEKARWECCEGDKLGAWCPEDNDTKPYYQVNLPKPVPIGTIGIQLPARESLSQPQTTYMKNYTLAYHKPGPNSDLITLKQVINAANSSFSFTTSFEEPIVTDKLKIIPKGWENSPCFRFELYTCDNKGRCPLGCKNGGTCTGTSLCHCRQGFYGFDCRYTETEIKIQLQVTLTFQQIVDTVLVTPAYNLSLHGHPKLVDGRIGKALFLNGQAQFMEIKKENIGCLANVGRCQSGFTLSMDINFITIEEGMYVFSSGGEESNSSGITCRVHNSEFEVTVSTAIKIWTGTFPVTKVQTHRWTKFEYSWSVMEGLYVYLNSDHAPVVKVTQPTALQPKPTYQSGSLVFGSSSLKTTSTVVYGHYIIENVKTWSVSRTTLVQSGVIDVKCPDGCLNNGTCTAKGKCNCVDGFEGNVCELKKNQLTQFNLTFVSETHQEITSVCGLWKVEGGPKINHETAVGTAVSITTFKHYLVLELNPANPCLSDIDLCFKGITYHMDLNIHKWSQFTYFVSNGGDKSGTYGIAFYYALNNLSVAVTTRTHMWTVRFQSLPEKDVWHRVEYSWSVSQGLTVYLNNTIVGRKENGTEAEVNNNKTFPIRIGTPSYIPAKGDTPSFQIANIQIWLTTRTILESFHILPATLPEITTEVQKTSPKPSTVQVTASPLTTATEVSAHTNSTPSRITEKVTSDQTATAKPTHMVSQLPNTTQTMTSPVSSTTPALQVSTEKNYTFNFANLQPNQKSLVHKDVDVTLEGGAKVVTVDSLKAIHFQSTSGTHQFLKFHTEHRSCLNDITLCQEGLTVSFKMKLASLDENTYILSSGGENPTSTGLAILYRFGRLQFVFSQNERVWFCHAPRPTLNVWTTIDFTWQQQTGLEVFVNNVLVDQTKTSIKYEHSHSTFVQKHFYFAYSTTPSGLQQGFVGYLASFSSWFTSRPVLVQQGILQPATLTLPTSTKTPTTKAVKILTTQLSITKAGTLPITTTQAPTITTTIKTPTTRPPVITPGVLTCPVGCVKKDEIALGKPDPPETPSLTIQVPQKLQGSTYFVCKFRASQQANLIHNVRWLINEKELPMSKQVLPGTSSEAKLDPAKLSGSLLNKKICCSVQNEFTSICGGKYSKVVISNCITPEIKLLTPKLSVQEGLGSANIKINITVPPSALCSVETGSGCEVRVLTTLVESSHDKKCSSRPLPEVVFLPHVSGSRYHSCGASFLNTNWRETMEIEMKATIDGVYDRNQARNINLSVRIVGITSLQLIKIGVVQVTVIDGDRRALCSSTGDPHIQTYDGQRYNNYLEGELIMYKHQTRPYEVRARTMRCSSRRSRPTCNCGIAVRAGDDVITLSRCEIGEQHHHDHHHHHSSQSMALQLYKNGELTSGTTVRRLGCGQKYEVYLPTGTKITVQAVSTSFINFWITPSAADRNSVTGLCGTYNSNRRDDYMGPGGVSYSRYLRNSQPDPYIAAWRVAESIFTGVAAIPGGERQRYCHCYHPEHAPCGISYDINRCVTTSAYDITNELIKQARAPRLVTTRHRRAAPNTAPTTTAPTAVQQTNCANSSWTLDQARDYCQEYLDNSTAAMRCDAHFNLSSVHRVDDCAVDLQCTDDVVYARSMIDDIISYCVEEVQKHNTPQTNDTTRKDLVVLVTQLCLEECQNGGSCQQGVCSCADGFTGVDCSVGKNSTPIVDPIPADGEPCDLRGDSCLFVPVTGDDFVDTEDLKCELTYVQVKDSVSDEEKTDLVNATYVDISRVSCPLYSTHSVKVKVTNNGQVFSQQSYLHVVYDSKCSTCRLDTLTNTASCKQREDICQVAGQCYNNGETKDTDQCSVCDTTRSKTTWSVSKVPDCSEPEATKARQTGSNGIGTTAKIIIGVVCGAVGLCIIFAAVYLWKRRFRSGRREQLNETASASTDPPHTVELHREKTDMIKPMICTNQAFREESIRS
ncbi:uncharacterized protein LOC135466195 isoform X2 [Liolophura sinensis]|uniref:uncharacterized protein LOC135466195 isoform X2 n=1 Tax=Liolophura sinensis TaxID=3198878 RepID=UPI0031589CCD